jgi:rubrerythrin
LLRALKVIGQILASASHSREKSRTTDPQELLSDSYRDLARLARQIFAHADEAPYPHVAARLRQIAEEKRTTGDLLRRKILGSDTKLDESSLAVNGGTNHWERMARDLADHTAVEACLLERAAILNESLPEVAELLRQTAVANHRHARIFLDLIARADPQAEQT